MLFNTRCPVCASTFAVAPETMAQAGGWVRCGRCANVFEAGAHRPGDTNALLLAPTTVKAKTDTQTVSNAVAPLPDLLDPHYSERRLKRILGKLNRSMDRVAEATGKDRTHLGDEVSSQEESIRPKQSASQRADTNPHIERRNLKRPGGETEDAQADTKGLANPNLHTTVYPGTHGTRPLKMVGRRATLAILVLTLCLQAALAFRTEAATHYPSAKPTLQRLCAVLGCELTLLAAPGQLSVESSGFQLVTQLGTGASHQFSWDVRNLALYPVKAPALELSLTDALDRPVVRKVLHPRDLGLSSEAIEADGRWVGELPIQVVLPSGTPAIAGYRVTAFYP